MNLKMHFLRPSNKPGGFLAILKDTNQVHLKWKEGKTFAGVHEMTFNSLTVEIRSGNINYS